ncbi:MAG TPA: PaaI family thioesterase [Amycolatopsis sp.]|nr:PaaI family thioesterase [Amycolatopsis sp.]
MSTPEQPDHRGPDGLARPWDRRRRTPPDPPEGFTEMIDALRVLQNRITAAAPPADLVGDATKILTELATRLEPYEVPEREQLTGHLSDVPGRAQSMTPVLLIDEYDDFHVRGRVTFGRFYLGGNGAVHGGAIPLVFDEILGRLSNTGERLPSRTAYLHVDYRSITPIEKELQFSGEFVSEEGRKRVLRGTIRDGETLCAEAEGLFVQLRPGQP